MRSVRAPLVSGAWLVLAWGLCALAVGPGCSGITVRRVNSPDLLESWRASIAGTDQLSARTVQTLRRWDLDHDLARNPARVVATLHGLAVRDPQPDLLFALAEIHHVLGREAEKHDGTEAVGCYYLCAAYAYHYLLATSAEFPATAAEARSGTPLSPRDAFDPRFRLACDLYNAGLAKCIASAQRVGRLDPRQTLKIPTSDGVGFSLSVSHYGFAWKPEEFGPLLLNYDFEVRGLANHYRTYGLGVPLIGTRADPGRDGEPHYLPPNAAFPVTAFFRFEGSLADLGTQRSGQLELYNPLTTQSVTVRGRTVPLESDLTTPLGYFLAHSGLPDLAYEGFLRADKVEKSAGIHMLEPYQPGKIPVVLVHGLLSSPLTWAPLFNDLRADPELRRHYQFWFYFYPTGNPYLATAADLRQALTKLRADFDPKHQDEALDHMVFVGHSMGGLVSKLMTVNSGDDFWNQVSGEPLAGLKLRPDARAELQRVYYFERQPGITRVIFLGTPHHGSKLSPSWPGRLAAHLVRLPRDLMETAKDLTSENPSLVHLMPDGPLPTSVDLLAPGAPALELLAARPRPEPVHYHSIIGVTKSSSVFVERLLAGDSPHEPSDGVVPYRSAHLDNVDSELTVPADHFHVHQHPLSVIEVRRILMEHLRSAETGVMPVKADGEVPAPVKP